MNIYYYVNMKIKKLLGKQIKEKRLQQSLTQEQLAEKIGISPKSLSQIELGNNFVSAENMEKICSALKISPSKLFDFERDGTEEKLDYVLEKLNQNPALLEKVYQIVKIIE